MDTASAMGDPCNSPGQRMVEIIRVDDLVVLRAAPPSTRTLRRGEPVLFVHGYFGDATFWSEWLSFFADRGFPAYALNLRGRRDSRPGTVIGDVSIDDFVADAAAVARSIGMPAVVGHSMGGLIAQRLAEEGRVNAAVLVTPAPPRGITVLSPRLVMKQIKYLPAILRSKPVQPAREDLRELVLNCMPPDLQDPVLDTMVPDSGRAARDMSITGVPVDRRRVRCPLLVVASQHDRFIPPKIVARIAARYGAPLRMMEGHGHMVILEPRWQTLADLIARWLAEQPSPT